MSHSILVFSGSLRANAFSKSIAKALKGALEKSSLKTTYIELNEYDLPLLNQDETLAASFPDSCRKFRKLIDDHDALVIVTPEHNYSIPASLKNALDWASRSIEKGEPICRVFKMKPVWIVAASPSPFGGTHAATHLQSIMTAMGSVVFPKGSSLIGVHNHIDEHGLFKADEKLDSLTKTATEFAEFVAG